MLPLMLIVILLSNDLEEVCFLYLLYNLTDIGTKYFREIFISQTIFETFIIIIGKGIFAFINFVIR